NLSQVIHSLQFELPIVALQSFACDGREQEVQRLVQEEALRPFDLFDHLPIRARLLRLDEQQHILLVVMHHMASDSWSVQVFMRELQILYRALREERALPVSPLPIQYADYTIWQQEWLQGSESDEQLSYWKKQLAGLPDLLELPTVHARPAVQ